MVRGHPVALIRWQLFECGEEAVGPPFRVCIWCGHKLDKIAGAEKDAEAMLANPLLDFDKLLLIKRLPLGDPRLAKNKRGLGEFHGVPRQSS